jgi:hypothetical protein
MDVDDVDVAALYGRRRAQLAPRPRRAGLLVEDHSASRLRQSPREPHRVVCPRRRRALDQQVAPHRWPQEHRRHLLRHVHVLHGKGEGQREAVGAPGATHDRERLRGIGLVVHTEAGSLDEPAELIGGRRTR